MPYDADGLTSSSTSTTPWAISHIPCSAWHRWPSGTTFDINNVGRSTTPPRSSIPPPAKASSSTSTILGVASHLLAHLSCQWHFWHATFKNDSTRGNSAPLQASVSPKGISASPPTTSADAPHVDGKLLFFSFFCIFLSFYLRGLVCILPFIIWPHLNNGKKTKTQKALPPSSSYSGGLGSFGTFPKGLGTTT
jgi:hypothetical protein